MLSIIGKQQNRIFHKNKKILRSSLAVKKRLLVYLFSKAIKILYPMSFLAKFIYSHKHTNEIIVLDFNI